MPTSNYVQVAPNSSGLKVDTSELTSGANTVERQNVCIADPSTAANVATVTAAGALTVVTTTPIATSTSALTNVTATITSTTILAANSARKNAIFFNDGGGNLYLGFTASAVATTSYSVKIPAAGLFEMPSPVWTGQVTGIWDVASGTLRVTEFS